MENEINKVPIHLKMALTTREAAEYSNIGINKIDSIEVYPMSRTILNFRG